MDTHNRNQQIEGLRGIAIVIIVIYHLFCRYLQLFYDSDIGWMHHFGTFGVGIFMMISCYYLIPMQSYSEFDLKQYFIKKFLRLWPGYSIAITIIFLTLQFYPLEGRTSTFADYIFNIFFINGFVNLPYIDGAHWYLTTLISIIVIIGIARKLGVGQSYWFYIIWAIISICTSFLKAPYLNILFAKGYVGYVCISAAIKYWSDHTWNKIVCGCVAIVGLACITYEIGKIPALELVVILPIFYLSINGKASILSWTPFVWIGTISYSLYLLHQNIGYVLIKIIENTNIAFWINGIIVFIILVGLSWGFHVMLKAIESMWKPQNAKS